MTERKLVIPGEEIAKGDDFLPGENTEKRGDSIIALKYGLAEESNKLMRIIPLSGAYQPRRGNSVIGKVVMLTFNGWVIDIGAADNAFLSLMEVPRFVNKDQLEEVLQIGDMLTAKIWAINKRGIDLSIKDRGLGRIDEGMTMKINPNKVPRLIGKEGSMIKIVKDETGCNITVGQNGIIWLKGDKVENELFAKKAIEFIESKSYISGLTDEVQKWFGENKK